MIKRKVGLLLVLLLTIALFVAGCGETTIPERVNTNTNNQSGNEEVQNQPVQETFKVGETVKMGNLHFTLNGVRFEEGDQFIKPDDGIKWITFDCTLENVGNDSAAISSLLMFKLYDADSYSKDLAFTTNLKGSLDGEIGPGRKMAGEIAFEVEEGEEAWELVFEPDVFGFGQAIYEISIADISE